jgi:hypothetical protein
MVIVKGLTKISQGLAVIEDILFGRSLELIAKGFTKISQAITRIEETLFGRYIDELGTKISDTAKPGKALMLKQDQSSNYRNYIAAAVVGFILIVILIILAFGVSVI